MQSEMNKTRSIKSGEVQELNKGAKIIAGFEMQAAQVNQKQIGHTICFFSGIDK
jgi:hypothetical protein